MTTRYIRKTAWLCAPALCWLCLAGTASAEDAPDAATRPPSAIQISANAGVVSDYRFRGLSLSNRDPAVQGGLDLTTTSGWFAGTWASSIANNGGSHTEVDLYGGHSGHVSGLDYSGTFYAYVYPGGHGVNYVELQGSLGKTIGPVTVSVLLAFTPNQKNTTDNLYTALKTDIALPDTPLTVHLRAGRENGAYDNKWDWETGLAYTHKWLTVSASYIDTNYSGIDEAGREGRAALVGSVIATF